MGYIVEFLIDTKPGEPQDIGHKERYSEKVEEGGFPGQDCGKFMPQPSAAPVVKLP